MISREVFNASIVPFTLQYEGGYANTAGDRGGETYRGISRVYNPSWQGWATVDARKPLRYNAILPELETEVKQYYWDKYFSPEGFAQLKSKKVALALFDFTVHGGYSPTKLKTAVTAQTGRTLSAGNTLSTADTAVLNKMNETKLVDIILRLRTGHLANIVKNNPSQVKFADGWSNRLNKISGTLGLVKKHPVRTAVAVGATVLCITAYILFNQKHATVH